MFWSIAAINALVIFLLFYYKPIGFMVFDILTSMYTFVRLKYELYDPFKPQLKIHGISYFFKKEEKKLLRVSCEDFQSLLKALEDVEEKNIESIALSITYSFSDWNQKFIKLIDLKTKQRPSLSLGPFLSAVLEEEIPTYNEYNYDYKVSVLSSPSCLKEKDIPSVKANLEAYLFRTPTFEAEQTLELLRKEPEVMEFIYNDVEFSCSQVLGSRCTSDRGSTSTCGPSESSENFEIFTVEDLYNHGDIGFLVADDLGQEFLIQVPR